MPARMIAVRHDGEMVVYDGQRVDHRISETAIRLLEEHAPGLSRMVERRFIEGAHLYGRQCMDLPESRLGREAAEELADYVVYMMYLLDRELSRLEADRLWKVTIPLVADLYRLAVDDGT